MSDTFTTRRTITEDHRERLRAAALKQGAIQRAASLKQIEEVRELIERGMDPRDVADEVGSNVAALARKLYRYEEGTLATIFEHARVRDRDFPGERRATKAKRGLS